MQHVFTGNIRFIESNIFDLLIKKFDSFQTINITYIKKIK